MFLLPILALALAPVQAFGAPPAADVAPCTLCDAERLRPWLRKLARARTGGRAVRIVQIGDSHTAGDQITGAWRTTLQARYGGAGRGVLPPGRPYQGYLTRGITASQGPGWSIAGIFGPGWRDGAGPPRGLTGYSATTAQDGASLSLVADPGELFDRFTVCGLTGPGAGTLTLAAGARTATLPLDAPDRASACRSLDTDAQAGEASVIVAGGPATITSWATEQRAGGGVIVSNLGTVGAQFVHWTARTDEDVVAAELKQYRPDLVVIAFGTNEAFMPGFSATEVEAAMRAGIGRVRRLAPGVPLLVLGASDSGTRLASLKTGRGGVAPPCPDGSPWSPTAALATVQAIQRAVAHDLGAAYWDWGRAMGGRCAANAWAGATPALMRGDHVHFTTAGAAAIARLLQADLDAAAARLAGDDRQDP